jgi:cytosine permease
MSDTNQNTVKIKDYEREPVPVELRKGWVSLGAVWLGIGICLASVIIGGTLGGGLTMSQAFLAAILGALILATISALCSIVGAKTGLSTGLVSKFALGEYGSYAVSAIIAIALFGWFGVQTQLFGASAQHVLNELFGFNASETVLSIIGGLLMTTTAIIGFKAIQKLSILAVPLMSFLLVASLWKVLNNNSWSELSSAIPSGEMLPLGVAISIVVGSFVVGAVIGPDIARYARTPKDAVLASFSGFFVGFGMVLAIGAVLSKATSESDIVAIMLGLGWGTFAMLILILGQWTTNDNNLYSAALGFSVIFKKIPKYQLTIVAGLIGTLLAALNIYGSFIPFLIFLSALIPPIGGIYVADFFANQGKYQFENLDNIKKINRLGVSTWIISTLVAFSTTPAPNGFGWFNLTKTPALDAFLVALILQYVLVKLLSNKKNIKVEQAA